MALPEIHVLPLKNGLWRTVWVSDLPSPNPSEAPRLSPRMMRLWQIAYRRWWATKGNRLAISPEMWVKR